MNIRTIGYTLTLAATVLYAACAPLVKLQHIRRTGPTAGISVAEDKPVPDDIPRDIPEHDTLIIKNVDGRDVILMRAIRDDDGQMVANQVLEAARVTARFRNVAERHGKIDIGFRITVPALMQDSRWQLRYSPVMYVMEDTVNLDKVVITGREYRKRQLRGYQQYQRFLDRIITDSTRFIRKGELELFISRNLPEVYAFRNDSSFVSDETFRSVFGVTEQEAVNHYTDKLACRLNDYRISQKGRMYRKYVKAPIITEGIRLDTVMAGSNGEYIYDYVQTVNTRPKLRRVDVRLAGELYEQDRKLCDIDSSETLNFYISSLSAFVDGREKYITRIVERRVEANSSYDIAFTAGKSDIVPRLGDNLAHIAEIKEKLRRLLCNDSFDLDSVIVTASASPEGSFAANASLSGKRGRSVAYYFDSYMKNAIDSLNREAGARFRLDGQGLQADEIARPAPVPFKSRFIAENWEGLDNLVETDCRLSGSDKKEYLAYKACKDPDERERRMRGEPWYGYVRSELYPALRTVNFRFHMHRKGMVKDTVHTTVLDSVYMEGVQAIQDRDYEKAVTLLMPYGDYNTAVAYCALDRNRNALGILEKCEKTAQVNYMLALLYSREGNDRTAVEHYLNSCAQNPQYVHRGNLDPEIARLIKTYGLDRQEQEL